MNWNDNVHLDNFLPKCVKFDLGGKVQSFCYDILNHNTFYAIVKDENEALTIKVINDRKLGGIFNPKIHVTEDLNLIFI
jgi:hypothetical protein